MDSVIKAYFDSYRLNDDVPPEIKGKITGELFSDIATLEKWRNWRQSELCYEDRESKAILVGALDDCLVEDDLYIPLDYKTSLVYYWPEQVEQNGIVRFHVEPIRIKTNIESAKKIIRNAAKLLSLPMPKSDSDCEYCNLVTERKGERE